MKKQLFLLSGILFFMVLSVDARYYRTIRNGNWTNAATWLGGRIPPDDNPILINDTVIINHTVFFNTGDDMGNEGLLRIQSALGSPAELRLPTATNFVNHLTGKIYIIDAKYTQYRFTPGNNGEPYSGNTPGAPLQAGSFNNIGGYIYARNFVIEVAQDFTCDGGIRNLALGCLTTGQNYTINGSTAIDSLQSITISIGWHGSGTYALNTGFCYFQNFKFIGAGTSGHFELNSGTIAGSIDTIALRNYIVPFHGGGQIIASSSVIGTANLTAYIAPNGYNPNGKFTGSQTDIFGAYYTPANCNWGNVLQAYPSLSILAKQSSGMQKAVDLFISYNADAQQQLFIEYSSDGNKFEDFKIITTSNTQRNHTYTHTQSNVGNNYYRLKGVLQSNGYLVYSNIAKVLIKEQADITIYPVPVINKQLQIFFGGKSPQQILIKIMSAIGEVLFTASTSMYPNTKYNYSLKKFEAGTYFLQTINPRGVTTTKALIIL